jgi:hypothetical protein
MHPISREVKQEELRVLPIRNRCFHYFQLNRDESMKHDQAVCCRQIGTSKKNYD